MITKYPAVGSWSATAFVVLAVLGITGLTDGQTTSPETVCRDKIAQSSRPTRTVPELALELVKIEPGTFTMGSPETEWLRGDHEGPQTRVTISKGFWMGKYELTQRQYQELMGNNSSYFTGNLNRPVERVSWYDAVNYCEKLTQRERAEGRLPSGYVYRLPTEAEWEYACRAGTTTRYSFGDALECRHECDICCVLDSCCGHKCDFCDLLGSYMWWCGNEPNGSKRVGRKKPNPWGLYDMHGNVWEWCLDWCANSYPGGSVTDPVGPDSGRGRVVRGGYWECHAKRCRSAHRGHCFPDNRHDSTGFRLVLAPVICGGAGSTVAIFPIFPN